MVCGGSHEGTTELSNQATCGLGELCIRHPPGTFPITPASLISLCAVGTHQHLLSNIGIDWGAGSGVLSIAAAKIGAVTIVYGLDIVADNVRIAGENAVANGVAHKTAFLQADSFVPMEETDRKAVAALKGRVQFVLANPPASVGDDGFSFRRRVLREARAFLAGSGVVFLSISSQYGGRRIEGLAHEAPGFEYRGLLATTDWIPFDLRRPDLLACLMEYVREERRGGLEYEYRLPGETIDAEVGAAKALAHYEQTQESPLSRWQTHLFVRNRR